MKHILTLLAAGFVLAACGNDAGEGGGPASPAGTATWEAATAFHASGNPVTLEEWGQFRIEGERLVLADGVVPYGMNTALFSDYALKLRTVWLPEGAEPASWHDEEVFEFPVGTVITKTFYYPRGGEGFEEVALDFDPNAHFDGRALDLSAVRVIETRILVRREAGWAAIPYAWNEDQRSTRLARTGAFVDLTLIAAGGRSQALNYQIPDVNQCAQCHITNAADAQLRPIGPRARHLNGGYPYAHGEQNQLAFWREAGLLAGGPAEHDAAPRSAVWHGETTLSGMALDAAARAYIDINCAHCHSRTGHARTSGLYLEPSEMTGPAFGVCKPPIAAGRGTGNRLYSIVPGDSDASIFTFRMETTRPDAMMPELGRSVAHTEGLALVARWIDAMAGGC
ncbi:SO2930 family diheme c-type cytochrome [Glycocaulis abyssi]|uniref:SO2930 family diheme c-type cytochrome n=1 Tax=Glycocaulis abyssi TaxID=1433403 RepID=A0ABV9NBY2_9PROT